MWFYNSIKQTRPVLLRTCPFRLNGIRKEQLN